MKIHTHNIGFLIVPLILFAGMAVAIGTTTASQPTEQDILNGEKQQLQVELGELRARRDALSDEKELLEIELAAVSAELEAADVGVESLRRKIAIKDRKLDQLNPDKVDPF